MELEEYRTKVQRRGTRKQFVIRNSWGVYDIYKHIRKNGWYNIGRPVTEKEFYAIIRGVNKLLAEELALGHSVRFPQGMGTLELRRMKRGVSFVDGALKITYPVNWSETMKLWYEDAEARKDKTLLRYEVPYTYRIRLNVFRAKFINKSFYQFRANRFLLQALYKNIQKGIVNTLYSDYG